MGDRIKALTVVLAVDVDEDDIEAVENAIGMIRNVAAVERHVVDIDDFTARTRVRNELWGKLHELFWPEKK